MITKQFNLVCQYLFKKIFEQYLEDDSTLSAKGLLHKLSKSRQINRQKKKEEQDK